MFLSHPKKCWGYNFISFSVIDAWLTWRKNRIAFALQMFEHKFYLRIDTSALVFCLCRYLILQTTTITLQNTISSHSFFVKWKLLRDLHDVTYMTFFYSTFIFNYVHLYDVLTIILSKVIYYNQFLTSLVVQWITQWFMKNNMKYYD